MYHNFCSDENKGNVDNPSEFDDKFFLLNYEIKTETFQIMRTGKEYCQLEGNNFNELFPLFRLGFKRCFLASGEVL